MFCAAQHTPGRPDAGRRLPALLEPGWLGRSRRTAWRCATRFAGFLVGRWRPKAHETTPKRSARRSARNDFRFLPEQPEQPEQNGNNSAENGRISRITGLDQRILKWALWVLSAANCDPPMPLWWSFYRFIFFVRVHVHVVQDEHRK